MRYQITSVKQFEDGHFITRKNLTLIPSTNDEATIIAKIADVDLSYSNLKNCSQKYKEEYANCFISAVETLGEIQFLPEDRKRLINLFMQEKPADCIDMEEFQHIAKKYGERFKDLVNYLIVAHSSETDSAVYRQVDQNLNNNNQAFGHLVIDLDVFESVTNPNESTVLDLDDLGGFLDHFVRVMRTGITESQVDTIIENYNNNDNGIFELVVKEKEKLEDRSDVESDVTEEVGSVPHVSDSTQSEQNQKFEAIWKEVRQQAEVEKEVQVFEQEVFAERAKKITQEVKNLGGDQNSKALSDRGMRRLQTMMFTQHFNSFAENSSQQQQYNEAAIAEKALNMPSIMTGTANLLGRRAGGNCPVPEERNPFRSRL